MSIFRTFPPGRVISERRDHLHLATLLTQKFAERDIVRRDAGDFRRIVDAPDNDSHLLALRTPAQFVGLGDGKEFVNGVKTREIITVAPVEKSFLPNVNVKKTQQRA